MPEVADFQKGQYALTAHIRDPARNPPPPGIEDRRLAIYRELFFNNVSQLLAKTFPVLRKLLTEEHWHAMMRDYFARHLAHTPLFLEMPQEFLKYLQEERGTQAGDPPFLLELAHYEWVELALSIDEAELDLSAVDPAGDLLDGVPVVSPLAWPLTYSYPVQRISPEFQPQEPPEQPTFLVVYRDPADEVGFLEINAVTARLLELLEDEARTATGRELLLHIAGELRHPNPHTVVAGGSEILTRLRRHDVILGVRRS